MRIVVIGGTGHVGTYLVPRLVEAGHEVVCLSRGQQRPYRSDACWRAVGFAVADRPSEDAAGTFGKRILELKPDVVVDLICFTLDSAHQMVEALRGQVSHFLSCGSVWVHGPSYRVPTTEDQPRRPLSEYGVQKAAIEQYLLDQAHRTGFPATVVHPGHIVGPGWAPINPVGNLNPQVFSRIARGEALSLPNLGLETLHHVHADDVAQVFVRALENWSTSVGESFHALSPAALTLRGYAEAMYSWFGRPCLLRFLAWEHWRSTVSPDEAAMSWDHLAYSSNCSPAKAQRLLGYRPRYESLEAIRESVTWLIERGIVEADCT